MIIGIDAGSLSNPFSEVQTGTQRIIIEFLSNLGFYADNHDFRLYSYAKISDKLKKCFSGKTKNIVLTPTSGFFSFRIPLELHLRPVDAFIGFSQAIPKINCRRIGFVYDLGFLHYPDVYGGMVDTLSTKTTYLTRHANHIITLSNNTKDDIVCRYKCDSSKISVIYPGVSSIFTKPNIKSFRHIRPYFLYTGSMRRSKNIPNLIKGFSQFLKLSDKTIDLILCGTHMDMDSDIDQMIQKENIQNRIIFMNNCSDAKLATLYRGSVASVLPSWWEGFGFTGVEAIASGSALIYAQSGSLKEVIGEAGLSFNPADSSDLAKAFYRLTNDKLLQTKLKELGKKQARKFTWKSFTNSVMEKILETR